jgi:type II secretion system protein C
LCCLFAAKTVNAVIGSTLAVASEPAVSSTETQLAAAASWNDRQVILSRNLFNASLLAPSAGAPIEEDLEATKLPLTLLGTVAALEPENAWAAIEDREKATDPHRAGGRRGKAGATVQRIERRRSVLLENGSPRELVLADEGAIQLAAVSPQVPGPAAVPARPAPAWDAPPHAPSDARNPATLFSQARILPKYENGRMVGVQLNAIKPGSMFETIGIQNGDVIKELNGIKIDSPEQSAKILLEFVDAKSFNVVVDRPEGTQTFTYTPWLRVASLERREDGVLRRFGSAAAAGSARSRGPALAQPPGRHGRRSARREAGRRRSLCARLQQRRAGGRDRRDRKLTDKNFIYDDRVRGRVTVVSPTRITVDEAYAVFESVLQVKGFTTVATPGGALKVIPVRDAKETSVPTDQSKAPPLNRDFFITRLIPLQYIDAESIVNTLKPLVSKDASMAAYVDTNTVILTESASNIRRLLAILDAIDVETYKEELAVLKVEFADATSLATRFPRSMEPRSRRHRHWLARGPGREVQGPSRRRITPPGAGPITDAHQLADRAGRARAAR